ncbi:MAG: Ig-like domain-containing protein [Paludisphaera borealis]|uniref:Ig-like domain-containing protein n=1 Tax=Paludisphaera borealis TaxID=1387353 RepID=UPI00283ECAD9|nr:Ig-like domain-containing protein [Paludisphaera borealis]MDR3622460.1 Ig-like domain-containing protein [Paludisphaera borealis]
MGTSYADGASLDGGNDYDVLTIDAGGLALTPGNFSTDPSLPSLTVISGFPLTGGPVKYTNYEQVNVTNLAASPIVTGSSINAVQGQTLIDVVAATFTSAALEAKADKFLSTIRWGDGSQSAGVIVQDASNPSVFYVMGTHTYYEDSPALTTLVTVVSAGSTLTQIINGVPVSFSTPPSAPVTASGSAVVAGAAISLVVSSFSGFENVAPNPTDVVTATFTDAGVNPTDPNPAARYSATIDWGDGSGVIPIPASAISRNGTSNSFTITLPQHIYATPRNYVVTIAVRGGSAVATATGVAYIADAPLTASPVQPVIPAASEGVLFSDQVIGSFTDLNPIPDLAGYTVTIDWGDGSPQSAGRVVQPGGPGTVLQVLGTHTYADSLVAGASAVRPLIFPPFEQTFDGTYPIRIHVRDTYGSAVNLANTITINDRPITVSGRLDPASDSGVSNSDAITNVSQPTFQGSVSEGGAKVSLYIWSRNEAGLQLPFGGGQTTADSAGAWSFTSDTALPDGSYTVYAQAFDHLGHTTSAVITVVANLVIDTVGPKVTNLVFDNRGGRVLVTFQDFGGVNGTGVGLNFATIVDANNYRFALIKSAVKGFKPGAPWLATGISAAPGTAVGPQTATILINGGRGMRGGRYLFTVKSVDPANLTGVQDLAGNALDGEFYSFFPSGNNHVGGDFVAELDAVHHRVYAPKTTIGTASPVIPPGARGVDRFIGRNGRPSPKAAATRKAFAAVHPLQTRILKTANLSSLR